ncbi:YeeE/YedE family protein [Sporobolomyces salmoneus]|uniref:YeeE/YedE family protein n=1 Tax=Sporobolomyces salmoneus TaxID=183962 RepID=UPI003175299B
MQEVVVGGLLLSCATSTLLLDQGRVLGCSGVAHSTTESLVSTLSGSASSSKGKGSNAGENGWKIASLSGLIAGGYALRQLQAPLELVVGQSIFDPMVAGVVRPLISGLCVGLGTKLARGCTSGHMLIGMARFSKRSITATMTFFPVAFLTARLFSYPLPVVSPSTTGRLDLANITPSIAALFAIPIVSSVLIHRLLSQKLANLAQSFSLSFLFSLGLALTGMLRPSRVLSFFYVPIPTPFPTSSYPLPPWDPSLAFVALGGLLPNIYMWHRHIKNRTTPRKRDKFDVPSGGNVDRRLLLGSALFGIGWGLMGICPGPLLANLGAGTGGSTLAFFAAAFAVGGLAVDYLL